LSTAHTLTASYIEIYCQNLYPRGWS